MLYGWTVNSRLKYFLKATQLVLQKKHITLGEYIKLWNQEKDYRKRYANYTKNWVGGNSSSLAFMKMQFQTTKRRY